MLMGKQWVYIYICIYTYIYIYIYIYTYIVCEINKFNIMSYPTLKKYLFGAVSLIKNNDIDEYKISGYGIGFDRKGELSFGNEFVRNCIIFGVDMSSSAHVDNKKKIHFHS